MVYAASQRQFRIALSGDCMPTRALAIHNEPAFLAVRKLFGESDIGFANLETVVRWDDEGSPGVSRGTHMTTPPRLLDDLEWMGINMVACANNHAFDYGEGGVLATIEHLDRQGIVHAGSGRHLAQARAPAYRETRAGRVALVATTATFRPWHVAAPQRQDAFGRPGINPLGLETTHHVDHEAFDALDRVAEELGLAQMQKRDQLHFFSESEIGDRGIDVMSFMGNRFQKDEVFSTATSVSPVDLEENLRSVREARRQADWVIVSVHSHEFEQSRLKSARTRADLEEPAEAIGAFARAAIDEGADLVVGHGSHMPLGVEVYRGKPILYSLGNVVFQNETITSVPAEAYRRFQLGQEATPADFLDARSANGKKGHAAQPGFWESIIVTCCFEAGEFSHAIIDPIELGFDQPRSRRGRPMLAPEEEGARILARIARLSLRYDADIKIIDGRGYLRSSS